MARDCGNRWRVDVAVLFALLLVTVLGAGGGYHHHQVNAALKTELERSLPDLDQVRTLIRRGASVHVRDRNGVTALHVAVREDDIPFVRELLRRGADTMALDRYGFAPFAFATSSSMLRGLVAAGVDPDTGAGKVPLIIDFAFNGDTEFVSTLLELGADVNATDAEGRSALYWAVHNHKISTIRVLMAAGASVGQEDHHGISPLKLAHESLHPELGVSPPARE